MYENGSSPIAVVQETREFNAIFIHSKLDDAGLTSAQFRVYAHLARRAGANGAYPSLSSIARVCRLSRHTVIEALSVLWERGMIEITHTNGKANLYILTAPSKWKLTSANKALVQSEHDPGANGALPPVQSRHTKVIHIRKSKKGNPPHLVSEEGIKFARWFRSTLTEERIKGLESKWEQNFARAFDDNVRIDRREPQKIWAVCKLARSDDRFWRKNFQSPIKLRNRSREGVKYFDILTEQFGLNGCKPCTPVAGSWLSMPDNRPDDAMAECAKRGQQRRALNGEE